ncbi:MAG: hypothetical protein JXB48_07405 [Candidatus Latescibacteria bacterium]|nr:hypothetical protein [Candidatus Latescibacterota bacterium]
MQDKTIPRQIVDVSISLSTGRSIAGELQIDLDSRLLDFMNLPEQFIIIRDNNNALKILNKHHIVDINIL